MKRKVTRKRATSKRATPKRKSTRRSRKRSMLSEFFTPASAQGGMKVVVSGAVGAIAGQAINKMLPNQTVNARAGVKLLGGFLMATVGKMPNLGAGLSAVGVMELIQESGFLADNGGMKNANYANSIEALPPYLNENGQPMYLAENPMYLAENPMYLAQNGNDYSYDVGYYGAGFGMDETDF